MREKYKKEKEHREELDNEVEKWSSQHSKFSQDYEVNSEGFLKNSFPEYFLSRFCLPLSLPLGSREGDLRKEVLG